MNIIHRKSPATVLMGISLIGFLGLNPATAETSTPLLPVYVNATDTERLQSVLNEKGWDAQLDTSGSLIIQYYERIPTSPKQIPSAFQQFAKALANRGWSATRDEGGNLFLRPNQPAVETFDPASVVHDRSQTATADSLAQQQRSSNIARFSQRLASVGWRTDFTHQGDLLIHLPSRQPAKHAPEVKQVFQTPVQTGMDWLAARLISSGWMTHRDETGGLIFSRPTRHASLVFTDQTKRWPPERTQA